MMDRSSWLSFDIFGNRMAVDARRCNLLGWLDRCLRILRNPMADNAARPNVFGVEAAPITYFEGTGALGHTNGVFTIGLTVGRTIAFTDGTVPMAFTAVVLLKGNRQALEALRSAVDHALLLGAPVQGEAN